MNAQIQGYKKIAIEFKHFRREINTIWEAYNGIDFFTDTIHDLLKNDKISPMKLPSLVTDKSKQFSKERTFGVISHIKDKKNPRNALMDSISFFEHYIKFLITTVYIDKPEILKNFIGEESKERQKKLLQIIISSKDKRQIIEEIVEDKVNKMLYGKPADFFIKDKSKLKLKNCFKDYTDVDKYVEINARRNIYTHNNGRVDGKYLIEVKNSSFKKGQVAKIDKEYIKETINTLKMLAAVITVHVFEHIYKIKNINTVIGGIYSKRVKYL